MKKILLTILGVIFISNVLKAQDIGKNNEKYWYYRERLKWFMIGIGPNAGQSEPGSSRISSSSIPTTDPLHHQPPTPDLDGNGNPKYIPAGASLKRRKRA